MPLPTPEVTPPVVVPEPEKPVVPVPSIKQYIVKSGDVLYRIGKMFNTTWQKLAEYNNLKNPHLILPGQVINVPQ